MTDDLYNLKGTNRLTPTGPAKKPSKSNGLLLAVAVVAAVVLFVTFMVKFVLSGHGAANNASDQAQAIGATAASSAERDLITFAGQFLFNYYNYSAPLYQGAVQKASDMMTPELLKHYQEHALSRDFITLLQNDQVSTDGFRVDPNSYLFAQDGKTHWVQLSGTMTYTTGVNGAQAQWPTTVLLEILETDQGYKVNNVKGLR
jgi:hypothetical protein